jgi:UPF0755 protein
MIKKKRYKYSEITKRRMRYYYVGSVLFFALIISAIIVLRNFYNDNIRSVSSNANPVLVVIKPGSSLPQIASTLKADKIIRATWAFEWYVRNDGYASSYIEAGTFNLRQNMDVAQIVNVITSGKQASNLVTILPGQRIDQVETTLIRDGFVKSDVVSSLQISQYINKYPMLSDAPANATLEGYLYPDSFDKDSSTKVSTIINESLTEMQSTITSQVSARFAAEGLNDYEAVTLASIVEQEVSKSTDRPIVAQVFLSRLKVGMDLGSDVTAYYGSIVAGVPASLTYDSPYNTLIYAGLPPGPISNVSKSSIMAVAYPSNTNYLYFVSGDDGTTYFSTTLAEHDAQTAQYCIKLCGN